MRLSSARTFQSRLLARIETDPTASARTLRAVIRQHSPREHLEPDVVCACSGVVGYPCATAQTIALELGVPLPHNPSYDGEDLIDA